jgi:hypothetical protein
MVVFLFSLIGIPLTAGFAGKVFLIAGALGATPATPPGATPTPAAPWGRRRRRRRDLCDLRRPRKEK